jgi:hypothetical protein
MVDLLDILHSRPAILGAIVGHRYLKNTFLLPSERAAAGRLQEERPEIIDEVTAMLREIEDTFIDGYDPTVFVLKLQSLRALDDGLRERLLLAVRREYTDRFRPEERLKNLRRCAGAFLDALCAWLGHVSVSGVGAESAPLWVALQGSARALRELLEDRELSTRWIP